MIEEVIRNYKAGIVTREYMIEELMAAGVSRESAERI